MKQLYIFFLMIFLMVTRTALSQEQKVIHPSVGSETNAQDNALVLRLSHKIQQFDWQDKSTLDKDIHSPKSVNIHPNGRKFYVNSLEGCATVVYEMETWRKVKTIRYNISDKHRDLWSVPCGFFPFRHYNPDSMHVNRFSGKPVESTFSHNGRYLWVPFYRRTFDINAQDPSALAVIDTERDTIVKLMETGPLPKMIACSHDGKHIAVTHWGDNTVAVINAESENPADWQYEKLYVVDYQLKLDYSLEEPVNRDVNSGYCLRGTVFTPDDRYLLVGCMGGVGGIAVIDMSQQKYLGRVIGMRSNVRHLLITDGWLYLSCNADGIIQRLRLDKFLSVLPEMTNRVATVKGWEECAVLKGARTISSSPGGKFIFAACNTGSRLCVVDTRKMKMIASAMADSYPVGLDISSDGKWVILTSQGRNNHGGNAVDIFQVNYMAQEDTIAPDHEINTPLEDGSSCGSQTSPKKSGFYKYLWISLLMVAGILLPTLLWLFVGRSKKIKRV